MAASVIQVIDDLAIYVESIGEELVQVQLSEPHYSDLMRELHEVYCLPETGIKVYIESYRGITILSHHRIISHENDMEGLGLFAFKTEKPKEKEE